MRNIETSKKSRYAKQEQGKHQLTKSQIRSLTVAALALLCALSHWSTASAGGMGPPPPIILTKNSDILFGSIDFIATANGNIDIGTNGNIVYGAGYAGPGTGTAGSISLADGTAPPRDGNVFCSSNALIANAAGLTMAITDIEVVNTRDSTVGDFGTGSSCLGLGTPAISFRNPPGGGNVFVFGARIDGTSGVPAGGSAFSTTNPNGQSIVVEVVYI